MAFSDNYYKNSDALTTAFSIGQTAYDPSPNSYTGTSAFKNPDKNDFTVKNTTLVNAGVGNSEFVVKE